LTVKGEKTETEVLRRLDQVIALLKVAFGPELSRVRNALEGDVVSREILAATEEWVPAGDLTNKVVATTGKGERAVQRKLRELVELGVLESEGATWTRRYRSSGLI
jgi:hypothetical protein